MSSIGCCGRQVSLQGLVAQADAYPARSPRGQRARARLAYTIVAGKAAQAGNREVYQRAMAGLRGLGAEGDGISTHGTVADPTVAAAAAPAITATLTSIFAQAAPSASASFRQLQSWTGVLMALARIGTSIAGAFPTADRNAINVANHILSWIGTLINGTAPTIPPLDAAAVQGLVGFCQFKEIVRTAIGVPLGLAAGIITADAAANSRAPDAGALAALDSIRVWTDAIVNGICNIPQIAAAAGAVEADRQNTICMTTTPNSVWDPAYNGGGCVCAPGFVARARAPGVPGADCVPIPPPAPPGGGGPIQLTAEQRAALFAAQRGRTLTPRQQQLLVNRADLFTSTAGTLDPVTRCAPGESGNPCNGGICDGPTGFYSAGMTCVNGVPTKASSGAILPLAVGAAALFFLLK